MNQKFIQRVKALWEKFIQNRSIYKKLYAKYERATADLNKIRHNRNALRVEHKRTTDAFNQLREEHDKLFVKQDALSKNYERATADLDGVRRNLNALSLEHERTKSDFNKLRGEHDALSQKYKLISDLLDTKPGKNEKFEKFKKLVKKDFMNFANKESSLAEEAMAAALWRQRVTCATGAMRSKSRSARRRATWTKPRPANCTSCIRTGCAPSGLPHRNLTIASPESWRPPPWWWTAW